MIPPAPTEVVDGLIHAVLVGVRAIDVTKRTPGWVLKALDPDVRCAPSDRRQSGNTWNFQLRHDVTRIGKLAGLDVIELVEACAEFIDHRRRENACV